eukprot:5295347-Pyramimonas_sp.AAC.1
MFTIGSLPGTDLALAPKNAKLKIYQKIFCEVLCFDSELSYACKELYEVPRGDQVDGSPPAP